MAEVITRKSTVRIIIFIISIIPVLAVIIALILVALIRLLPGCKPTLRRGPA